MEKKTIVVAISTMENQSKLERFSFSLCWLFQLISVKYTIN